MTHRRGRKIVVNGSPYRWHRRHVHIDNACGERLLVFAEQSETNAQFELVIVEGIDILITTGGGWEGYDGGVIIDEVSYNLNRPAVVAELIQGALAEGWQPQSEQFTPSDGAAFFRRHIDANLAGFSSS